MAKRAAKRTAKQSAPAERKPGEKRYWLLKQEPTDFSFDDLWSSKSRTTNWEGVRNFRARNFLRDEIRKGDLAFFYHSNANPSAVVGVVEIVRDGYPDTTAFDKKSDYYDEDSDPASPRWFQVDVRAVERLPRPVSLEEIKKTPACKNMMLIRISQLSVQAVTGPEWEAISKLARS
ncbi:MAG TPA: EVE domain-containing protein [Gemmatimonadaceae bacterium]|nr:EVE domain-containing protein [Gemmatimonadaceae bacterium]